MPSVPPEPKSEEIASSELMLDAVHCCSPPTPTASIPPAATMTGFDAASSNPGIEPVVEASSVPALIVVPPE